MRTPAAVLSLALVACAPRATQPPPATATTTAPAVVHAPPPFVAPPSEAPGLVRSISDEVGPRLAGSAGQVRAEAWALRTLNALGFSNVHAEPVQVPHWERGEVIGQVLLPVPHTVAVAALGGSVGTPGAGVDAALVEVASLEALDALPTDAVQGRIVYVHRVMQRTRTGEGYGAAVPVRGRSASAAARKGALAVLVRSIGTDSSRAPHAGQMRYEDGVARIPAAAVSTADGDMLHRLVATGAPVRFHLVLGCSTQADVPGANIVGEVPGADRAGEVVLLGAHLDSWDLGTGALDDGAGVSIVLSAAHHVLTAGHPRRTVRVVLFANEENGTAGARGYLAQHRGELDSITVALEADAGDGRVFALRQSGSLADAPLLHQLGDALHPMGVRLRTGDAHGGADVGPLGSAGVPLLDLSQDMSRYFDHHHTANDTPAVLDEASLNQAVAVWSAAVALLATSPEPLPRASQGASQGASRGAP